MLQAFLTAHRCAAISGHQQSDVVSRAFNPTAGHTQRKYPTIPSTGQRRNSTDDCARNGGNVR
jgi:hypothetical protein